MPRLELPNLKFILHEDGFLEIFQDRHTVELDESEAVELRKFLVKYTRRRPKAPRQEDGK